jgi:uncharacterized protein GlcG (DUF336 family)
MLLAAVFSAVVLALPGQASAQVQLTGKAIPLDLAIEAAHEAVRSCEASGYRVSASVVDVAGVERAFLHVDHSTIHTRETAFKKSYTIATLGPTFGSLLPLNARAGGAARRRHCGGGIVVLPSD